MADSDGPQPSGCFNVRTTLVSKSLSVFEDKWRPGKAHASENIDAPRLRTVKQPEGCGPSEFHTTCKGRGPTQHPLNPIIGERLRGRVRPRPQLPRVRRFVRGEVFHPEMKRQTGAPHSPAIRHARLRRESSRRPWLGGTPVRP